MAYDFYNVYKDYPNLELLKIIRQPGDYQPEAVAAAKRILDERQVAPEELQTLDQTVQELAIAERYNADKFERIKAKTAELFPPVSQPHEKIDPSRWINLLLLVIGIQYAWLLFGLAKRLIRLLGRGNFLWVDNLDFLSIIYVPYIFYLLLKKRRWGWILLFADNLFAILSLLGQSFIFFKFQSFFHWSIPSFVTPIIIRGAFAFFLWRDAVAEHFGVNLRTKKQTLVITIAGTFLYVGLIYLIEAL